MIYSCPVNLLSLWRLTIMHVYSIKLHGSCNIVRSAASDRTDLLKIVIVVEYCKHSCYSALNDKLI